MAQAEDKNKPGVNDRYKSGRGGVKGGWECLKVSWQDHRSRRKGLIGSLEGFGGTKLLYTFFQSVVEHLVF